MATPYLNNGISMTTPINVIGPTTRVLPPSNSVLPQNFYHQSFLSPTNSTLDLSMVKPLISNVANGVAASPLWMGKERDNTWLQLPVCPVLYRYYRENDLEGEPNYNVKDPKEKVECTDVNCHSGFAHPPPNVMKHVLTSGYVVCCQSFVFATKNGTTSQNAGCVRGEDKCRYFHPPENLAQIVINAGRNNKRLRSEMETKLKITSALNAATLGVASNTHPYQVPSHYPFLSQNQATHPIISMTNILPTVNGGTANLNPGILSTALNNHSSYPNSSGMHKPSGSVASNFRSFAHHSSPAIDYRQPSPPGETPDKPTKEDDFPMAAPTSRKRIYHDENKNLGSIGMKTVNVEEKDDVRKTTATKESPLAKRRHGDTISIPNHKHSIPDSPVFVQTSIGNSFSNNGGVHPIPNLVSPTPTPVETTASLYSKAYAQQMKLLQQNQTPLIYNTPTTNSNIANQFTTLPGINRPLLNGITQVGSFDVDAYNAALYLNQSLAVSAQSNTPSPAYTSAPATTPFPTPFNIYDPTNTFWF